MSSQFTQSALCQLSRSELEEIPQLAARLARRFYAPSSSSSAVASASPLPPPPPPPSLDAVLAALLSEAHVRGLVVDALVRVVVPAKKRETLLLSNPYVMAAATAAARAQSDAAARQQDGASGRRAAPVAAEDVVPTHRVGRVVALLPKPGAPACSPSPADWLLAVNVGDRAELLPLRSIAEDACTEAEHAVYVQSALGHKSGAQPLLTGEQVEAVKRRVCELRAVLMAARGAEGEPIGLPGSGAAVASVAEADLLAQRQRLQTLLAAAAAAPTAAEGAGRRKRSRTEEDGGRSSGSSGSDVDDNDVSAQSTSDAVRAARLADLVARQAAQLQTLRQLSQKKDAEMASLLHDKRAAEQQGAAEASQLRAKAEDEARQRERTLRESGEQLKELNGTLRKVAQVAAKYKEVYNVLVTSALGFSPEEARAKTPEEVIALLRAKRAAS